MTSKIVRFLRRKYFLLLSNNKAEGNYSLIQACQFMGQGKIYLKYCQLGYWPSPNFYNGICYLEARLVNSEIVINQGSIINNGFTAISMKSITIGAKVLIGNNVTMYDSDFHSLKHIDGKRKNFRTEPIEIGNYCWIGSNVIILKGVTLGEGCVVAAGSVVTQSFDTNSLIGGNPAKLIKKIDN
jgi:maltose O-acetyltransferase